MQAKSFPRVVCLRRCVYSSEKVHLRDPPSSAWLPAAIFTGGREGGTLAGSEIRPGPSRRRKPRWLSPPPPQYQNLQSIMAHKGEPNGVTRSQTLEALRRQIPIADVEND